MKIIKNQKNLHINNTNNNIIDISFHNKKLRKVWSPNKINIKQSKYNY